MFLSPCKVKQSNSSIKWWFIGYCINRVLITGVQKTVNELNKTQNSVNVWKYMYFEGDLIDSSRHLTDDWKISGCIFILCNILWGKKLIKCWKYFLYHGIFYVILPENWASRYTCRFKCSCMTLHCSYFLCEDKLSCLINHVQCSSLYSCHFIVIK